MFKLFERAYLTTLMIHWSFISYICNSNRYKKNDKKIACISNCQDTPNFLRKALNETLSFVKMTALHVCFSSFRTHATLCDVVVDFIRWWGCPQNDLQHCIIEGCCNNRITIDHSYLGRGSGYGTVSRFVRPQTRVEDDPDWGGSRSNSCKLMTRKPWEKV